MYSGFYNTFWVHVLSFLVSTFSLCYVQLTCRIVGLSKALICLSLLLPAVNSGVSLLRYGMSEGYKLRKLHVVTLNLSMIGSCSLVHTALYIYAKSPSSYLTITALNAIPFIQNIKSLDYRIRWNRTDAIIAMNSLFLLWSAIENENFNAIAFALSFVFGYFYVGDCGYFLDTEVPSIDIYQYMQCFLCYFTANAFYD